MTLVKQGKRVEIHLETIKEDSVLNEPSTFRMAPYHRVGASGSVGGGGGGVR